MNKEDIAHLALLSRIELTESELASFQTELSSIVTYVGVITEIAAKDGESEPAVGARFNVFRSDEVTNAPDQYTDALLAEMPQTEGRLMKVKKILTIEE